MKLAILAMSLISVWSPSSPTLKHFQWKNRILIVFAPNETDERVQRQCSIVQSNRAGFEERDVIVFISSGQTSLSSQFHVRADEFAVLLIGKDGSEKLRQHSIIDSKKLFDLIDSMPMRRASGR